MLGTMVLIDETRVGLIVGIHAHEVASLVVFSPRTTQTTLEMVELSRTRPVSQPFVPSFAPPKPQEEQP